ncbi:TrbI/VirB10 family protein [Cupriavidus pauculus]|uniref:TrbI/VirB10 family protein n=1 Tax=Cupriavidus pauculus TaxID=82633 RepID=UPI0038571B75
MSEHNIDPALLTNANPSGSGDSGFSLRPQVVGITKLNNRVLIVAGGALVMVAMVGVFTFNSMGEQAGNAARTAVANQGKDQSKPLDNGKQSMWYMERPDNPKPSAPDLAGGAGMPADANAASAPVAAPAGGVPDLAGKANTLTGSVVNPRAPGGSIGASGAAAAASSAQQQAEQQRQLDAIQASKADLQAKGFTSLDPLAAARTQAAAAAAAATGGGATGGIIPTAMAGGPSDTDPNKQDRKESFLKSAKLADVDYNASVRTAQITPYEIKAGWVIPGVLIGGMNSDLPGQIIGQVRENVYDTRSGKHLLIPQGSRLIGKYDSYVAYGQARALVAWSRLIYPDGSTYNLRGMPGADSAGFAGFADQLDNHYARIFGTAALMSVISAGAQLSQPSNTSNSNGNPNASQTAAGALGQQLGQTGMQMAQKNLNIQPTIEIRPGYRFNVMVTADMALPRIDP